jgi:DNA gyrase inhibitor GyrI
MDLTETPDVVTWSETIYCYVEKVGPFQTGAAQAWNGLHETLPSLSEQSKITQRFFSRYKIEASIYRAGVALTASLAKLPSPLRCETFRGGKYARFILKGPYSQLPGASERVLEIVKSSKLEVRDDFFIENYVNDPKTTPEKMLITEILIPLDGAAGSP